MPLGYYYFPWRNVQVNNQAIVAHLASLSYAITDIARECAQSAQSAETSLVTLVVRDIQLAGFATKETKKQRCPNVRTEIEASVFTHKL